MPIDGWIVFCLAGLALIIDRVSAVLTDVAGVQDCIKLRAAFIDNAPEAMASITVIIAG